MKLFPTYFMIVLLCNFDFKNLQATINISIPTCLVHSKCTLKFIATTYTIVLLNHLSMDMQKSKM